MILVCWMLELLLHLALGVRARSAIPLKAFDSFPSSVFVSIALSQPAHPTKKGMWNHWGNLLGQALSQYPHGNLYREVLNRTSGSNPLGKVLEASPSENSIARSRNVALNSNVIAVYEDCSIILCPWDKNISTDWLMKNAFAHPRNAALNSNVIATCKDKISQGKTNSDDSSVETLMTYNSEKAQLTSI